MFKNSHWVAVAALVLSTGCASITQGTSQTISVNIEPKEAVCQVVRGSDGPIGDVSYSNPTLTVSKGYNDLVFTCRAPGYRPKIVKMVSSTSGAGIVGGVFLDLGIVDMMTGAMWKYGDAINIALEKE